MKKSILFFLAFVCTFCLGFGFKSMLTANKDERSELRKVTSIGGIFFKCKDPVKLKEWYKTHLGLQADKYGAVFEWRQGLDSSKKGFTQWSLFSEKTKYFAPSEKDFMINYRVADLDALLVQLKAGGVAITDSVQVVEYGKFLHIIDPEGNKIELWEPNDIEYEKLGKQMGAKTTK